MLAKWMENALGMYYALKRQYAAKLTSLTSFFVQYKCIGKPQNYRGIIREVHVPI